jgi:endonuclease YncB( thermonuclease family)
MWRVSVILILMTCLSAGDSPPEQVKALPFALKSETGPLVVADIEKPEGWISVTWAPNVPVTARRIDGQMPEKNEGTPFGMMIMPDYIRPFYGSKKQEYFQGVFTDGLRKLLEKNRLFWFIVTFKEYQPPGEIGGVLRLDTEHGVTLQEEMVRNGYAVVASDYWHHVGEYGDDFRDHLLILQGEAKAWKLGVWSSP